jgi:hypothetical protein
MKQLLFIFLSLSPLWVYSSCEDEDKLPGSKPEILLGKWENVSTVGVGLSWFGSYIYGHRKTIYEFTENGASVTKLDSLSEDDKYKEAYMAYFINWSYDGENIHFFEKKGHYSNHSYKLVYELNKNYFILKTESIYYKITD